MSHALLIVAIDPTEDVEAAVADQMEPYSEAGEWFKDGTRWDWYQIGGRFSGALSGYDPSSDPRNVETCRMCGGTGVRPGGLEQFGRQWFDWCKGCNGCNGAGKTEKWPSQWVQHDGDKMQVKLVDPSRAKAHAFLRNHRWDESGRMGWFGSETATECERAEKDVKRCLWREKQTEVLICSWNETREVWNEKFYGRFVRPLDPETLLVAVDYHV